MSRNAKSILLLIALLVVAYIGGNRGGAPPEQHNPRGPAEKNRADENWPTQETRSPQNRSATVEKADEVLSDAFEHHRSRVEVEGVGRVVRILSDDTEGTEHQKFILQLASGQELLVAHNTDLAERVPSLRKGDTIEFCGEYEWNEKGGVLHWTHHDPQGRHADGWLKHEGRVFQ
ncbi:MAG TPA: DUF3465 domain-containing protein [Pirellulales bacterium]|jgi:hypothetical protein